MSSSRFIFVFYTLRIIRTQGDETTLRRYLSSCSASPNQYHSQWLILYVDRSLSRFPVYALFQQNSPLDIQQAVSQILRLLYNRQG